MLLVRLGCACLSVGLLAQAQTQVQEDTGRLPVKRVVLYKNGVGYFEHVGRIRDNQDVTIPFTSGQLNDVLKSLTVLDLSGGKINGVTYGSSAPIDRQLGELRLPGGEKATLTEFLSGLRGAKMEVRNGTAVLTGRLLSVERKTRIAGGTTLEVDYLALVTETGEIRTTEVSPSISVRLLEPGLPGKVSKLLDLASTNRAADERRMTVSTSGAGERSLFVSYISEVPVWKATYRVLLSSKAGRQPMLQGWAIVDNTVGQDWDNVELSLVAGAPMSFIQNLAQPFYARRPVVALSSSLMSAPQTFESTLIPGSGTVIGRVADPSGAAVAGAAVKAFDTSGLLLAQTTTSADGTYTFSSLPPGPLRMEFQSAGFQTAVAIDVTAGMNTVRRDVSLQIGAVSDAVTVTAEAAPLAPNVSSSGGGARSLGSGRATGNAGRQFAGSGYGPGSGSGTGGGVYRMSGGVAARAQELGDLFEYKLTQPITIQKNRSALVPIVQAAIAAEKVSIHNESAGQQRPLRALWLTNSSGLTLDGGSFSVLDEETFAGEGLFEPIRAGEKRLVSYATDLALTASSKMGSEAQQVTRVKINRGTMTQLSELREKKTYTFRNEDSAARMVIVEHPMRGEFKLREDLKPAETTSAYYRFRVSVPAKETAALTVEESRPNLTAFVLTNLNSAQMVTFASQKSISKAVEAALRSVLAQKEAVATLASQHAVARAQMDEIFDDQQRLRENLKALKSSAEEKTLVQRYTKQLDEQETQLGSLRKEVEALDGKRHAAQEEVDKMIADLSFDEAV